MSRLFTIQNDLERMIFMECKNTYCVYIHTNKINGKKYVGQTICGDNPNRRWRNGFGYQEGTYFRYAINKYGWDNFDHDIIMSNLTLEEANHFEELLIKQLNTTNSKYGYNLKSGGENNYLSEETKRKIGDGNKGKKRTEEHIEAVRRAHNGAKHTVESKRKISNGNIRRNKEDIENWCVVQYDKNGTLKHVYDDVAEASRDTGISTNSINNCLAKYAKSAGGYMWIRANSDNVAKNILPYYKMDLLNTIHNTDSRQVPVNQFDKQSNLIKTWSSMTDAAHSLNIGINNIWKCCNNLEGRKSSGGFIWKYIDS